MAYPVRRRLSLLLAFGLAACGDSGKCEDIACLTEMQTPRRPDAGGPSLVSEDAACVAQSVHATPGPPSPVDVIFVVDNSGSMTDEIAQIRENINREFAAVVADGGVDYHVIMISRYGSGGADVCVEPPLSGASCSAGVSATNSPTFYHYSQEIGSNDALCQVLATFDHGDQVGRMPQGWKEALRPDAQKAFVLISDDTAHCSYRDGETYVEIGATNSDPFEDALTFHSALLARSPEHFGVPPNNKYQFFSIVGMKDGVPGEPVFPFEPLQTELCDTAPTAGLSYQALSIITDALRYPVCEGRSFDAIFRVLAKSVITAAKIDCVFELPEPPEHQTLDLPSIHVEYEASGDGKTRAFTQVAGSSACKDDASFYIRDRIELCPGACRLIQADPDPELNVRYGCLVIPD